MQPQFNSETQLRTAAKAQQLNRENLAAKEDLFMCDVCLNAERGFYGESVLHPIASAKKLSALEVWQALGISQTSR